MEDAAESLGSYSGNRHTGTFGEVATLSFNGNKVITTGGGGMVITNSSELAAHAKHITTTAKVPHPYEFVHDEIGYNYRLPNLNAALGCAQMEQLPDFLRIKAALARQYASFFRQLGIRFVEAREGTISNYWLNAIVLDSAAERDALLEFMNGQGVMTRPIWRLMTHLRMFRDCQQDELANSQMAGRTSGEYSVQRTEWRGTTLRIRNRGKRMNVLKLIGRTHPLFDEDVADHAAELSQAVEGSRFLVIGGAGSIGQAVTREIFRRKPKGLHVVDISENNMVELVRDLRSTLGYIDGDFRTFALDCGSREFEALLQAEKQYDYVLNLSALKHVRSEKDPFTLMRMIQVNILNTIKTLRLTGEDGARKYFCVSTDKAANPANMMGASKRIMEMFLLRSSNTLPISTARFANVAFSDGSLLHGFNQRFAKRQPLAAPNDVRRYFVTPKESGELCLMSCILGKNRDIFFPKLSEQLHLTTFSDIAVRYIEAHGFTPQPCSTEDEARDRAEELIRGNYWPCYFFASDTTGEKDTEEFYLADDILDMDRYKNIGVIKNEAVYDGGKLEHFLRTIDAIRSQPTWNKTPIVDLFHEMLPNFGHKETGKYLDGRM